MTTPFQNWATLDFSDPRSAPPSHALVALVTGQHRCLLLAATADARAFAEKRRESFQQAARLDASARVVYHAFGSMFAAELAYLRTIRIVMPETYQGLIDRWRCWFLQIDLARGIWSPTNLAEHSLADTTAIVGPLPDKHAPPKLGELLDDVFDLCRYPAELAKAPQGRPCAYKEMGRCPAPCDGSETLAAYRARAAEAAVACSSRDALQAAITNRMTVAASEHDFERAAHLKSIADSLHARAGRRFEHMTHLHAFARVAVVPDSANQSHLFLCRADGMRDLGPLPHTESAASAAALRIAATLPPQSTLRPTRRQLEELWFACRRLFLARRAEDFLTLADASDPATLLHVASRPATTETESETVAQSD